MSCATEDCGRADCAVCRLARVKVAMSASTKDPMRDDARAHLKVKKRLSPLMPRKRHRVGPHR